MASSQPLTGYASANRPMHRSGGHIVAPDPIDDVIDLCLIWVLPTLFLCGIVVLGTMLTTYTLVMRRPLPRLFTFIIVITFAVLITITFFLLVTFHNRRCQRARSTLSEAFTDESDHDFRNSFQSSDFLLRAAQGSPAGHPSIPLRKTKRQANIRQATQEAQYFKMSPVVLKATNSFYGSTKAPPSSHSSREAKIREETEPLRPSTPPRPPPLIIPSASFDDPPPPFVPFVPEPPKEAPVYYLPPGPLSPLPSAGYRPMWADRFERQTKGDQKWSNTKKGRRFWQK